MKKNTIIRLVFLAFLLSGSHSMAMDTIKNFLYAKAFTGSICIGIGFYVGRHVRLAESELSEDENKLLEAEPDELVKEIRKLAKRCEKWKELNDALDTENFKLKRALKDIQQDKDILRSHNRDLKSFNTLLRLENSMLKKNNNGSCKCNISSNVRVDHTLHLLGERKE